MAADAATECANASHRATAMSWHARVRISCEQPGFAPAARRKDALRWACGSGARSDNGCDALGDAAPGDLEPRGRTILVLASVDPDRARRPRRRRCVDPRSAPPAVSFARPRAAGWGGCSSGLRRGPSALTLPLCRSLGRSGSPAKPMLAPDTLGKAACPCRPSSSASLLDSRTGAAFANRKDLTRNYFVALAPVAVWAK